MAKITDLLTYLRPELRGCPDFTLEEYALRVVRDFCSQTWVWSEWIEEWFSSGVDRYTLQISSEQEMCAAQRVWTEGEDIPEALSDHPGPDDGNFESTQERRAYVFFPPADIRFLSTPNSDAQFFVYAAMQPSLQAATFPDWIHSRYEEFLLAGVKSRLMLQPGQNWTNPNTGEYYRRLYESGVGRARIDGTKRFSDAPLRVKPKRFI